MAGPTAGTKATIAALLANSGIAVAKFIAFFFTRSASMLAESIHSVADATNQALLLLGIKRAGRVATVTHQFGYGRERYFWSFVVALVLFLLGGLFSIYEGAEKLRHPHEISSLTWAVGVLIFAIILEGFSLRTAVVEANAVRGEASWWSFIRHSRSPELPVVLLEDIGAMLGLFVALIGVTLSSITHNPQFDALGSLTIGILLCIISLVLAIELKSLLLGESASLKDLAAIEKALKAEANVEELIHFRTQHIGPDELLVAAKVKLRADLTGPQVVESINRIEQQVRADVPVARMIYIEPDIDGKRLWTKT